MTGPSADPRPAENRRRSPGRGSVLGDVVIVAALLLTSLPIVVLDVGTGMARTVLISLGLSVPLLWRRRTPMTVFVVIAVVGFGQWLVGIPLFADIAFLIAFYTVVAVSTRRRALAATALMALGVGLVVSRYVLSPADVLLPSLFLAGLVTAAGVLGVNVRIRRAYLSEVEQRAARLEFERDQHRQLAAAAERTRIAREMHDIIAHNLSVVIALTDGASFTVATDPERAVAAMSEVSAAGRNALGEMRRVLGVLRDDNDVAALTPAPGIADLDGLARTIEGTGLRARFTSHGSAAAIAPSLQTTIYRLVQEALTNTVKHAAGATEIDVTVRCEPHFVEVVVTDDGTPGADAGVTDAAGAAGKHGVLGMRERAAAHDGRLEVGPTPTGWRLFARFPTTTSVVADVAAPQADHRADNALPT